jgi:hypothetical protein
MQSPIKDFDFFIGNLRVSHRRLEQRLAGCQDWETFTGETSVQKILGGYGNIDDNVLELPGEAYRAISLRSFDTHTGCWSILWLDGRYPSKLDTPVVGRFEEGIGTFLAADVLEGNRSEFGSCGRGRIPTHRDGSRPFHRTMARAGRLIGSWISSVPHDCLPRFIRSH